MKSKKSKIRTSSTLFIKLTLFVYLILISLLFIPVMIFCFLFYPMNQKSVIQVVSLFGSIHWYVETFFLSLSSTVNVKGIEKIDPKNNYLIVANHIGSVDYLIILNIIKYYGMLHALKFTLKDSLFWVPILGPGMYIGGFCFLTRNFEKDKILIKNWSNIFIKNKLDVWPVIYPEGTRITPSKKKESDDFAERNNLKKTKYTLLPRKKGFDLIRNAYKGYISEIVSISMFYSGCKMPTLFDIFLGKEADGEFEVVIDVFKNDDETNIFDIFETVNKNIENICKNK